MDHLTEVMKVEDAGRLLGISRGLAYQLAREGKLPGVRRLGSRLIVSRRELEHYLAPSRDG